MAAVDVAPPEAAPPSPPTAGALESAKNETSPSLGGVLTGNGNETTQPELTPASQGINSVVQVSGILRIIIKRP